MPDYKLTYFDGRARAEVIRLIFTVAGVPFEDVRISFEKWPELKSKTPFGALPILETGGQTVFQSLAIARFLARKFGLAGKTELDDLRIDMIVDSIEDTLNPSHRFLFENEDEKKKAELRKTYMEQTLPGRLDQLEKLLKINKNGDGYFVGDGLTWVDLHFQTLVSTLELNLNALELLKKYPKLKANSDRVNNLPKIKEYVAKRLPSAF